MGHALKIDHDVSPGRLQDYTDPCCIMSQQNAFIHPNWNVAFGPALCLPHLMQKGWMYKHRVYYDSGSWMDNPNGILMHLAAVTDFGTKANLGIRLAFNRAGMSWDYYLQYVIPANWDRGLPQSSLFIRRMGFLGEGETSVTLGSIVVPSSLEQVSQFIEPLGNVRFDVQRVDGSGKIITVSATAL